MGVGLVALPPQDRDHAITIATASRPRSRRQVFVSSFILAPFAGTPSGPPSLLETVHQGPPRATDRALTAHPGRKRRSHLVDGCIGSQVAECRAARTYLRRGGRPVKFLSVARLHSAVETSRGQARSDGPARVGVAFVSMAEGIDATTPAGRLQMHILGAIADSSVLASSSALGRGWRGPRPKVSASGDHARRSRRSLCRRG